MPGSMFQTYNAGVSTGTAINGGEAINTATGCTLQLGVPANGQIQLVEWWCSLNSIQTAGALFEVATTASASTMSTAHTTTTVFPVMDDTGLLASRLTMGTASTGYGTGLITTNTTLKTLDSQYVYSSYGKIWPLADYPPIGGSSAVYLQFRVQTFATVTLKVGARWIETI